MEIAYNFICVYMYVCNGLGTEKVSKYKFLLIQLLDQWYTNLKALEVLYEGRI